MADLIVSLALIQDCSGLVGGATPALDLPTSVSSVEASDFRSSPVASALAESSNERETRAALLAESLRDLEKGLTQAAEQLRQADLDLAKASK